MLDSTRPILITGGAGFIGSNLAHRLLSRGHKVVLLDSLARPGVDTNARALVEEFGARVQLVIGDVRDTQTVTRLVRDAEAVFHFAAQVAVTTSLVAPLHDFDVNLRGTLTVLEAVRRLSEPPPLLFTSTNKVYGDLADVALRESSSRYEPVDPGVLARGVDERRALDFHSPYGCSKGASDQYVLDYARCFGLPATVFRMSCIYGPRQFGTEDQGWVAHFLIRALHGQPITLYGDGKQVRDILFVEDLIDAMLLAIGAPDKVSGTAFNMGGGPANTVSLLELLDLITDLTGSRPATRFADVRTGDQRYYVSDTARFGALTGWAPGVSVQKGVERLHEWLLDSGDIDHSLASSGAAAMSAFADRSL
jgi:CDP-paratose 2-epimerase